MIKGTIDKIAGPLVVADGMGDARMFDLVYVSDYGLIGEVIELKGSKASIQVYEETGGLKPGDPVTITGKPLSVELGPGLLKAIYDGIQRPLDKVREAAGDWITRGINIRGLDHEKEWEYTPVIEIGTEVSGGEIVGTVPETEVITHKIMVPPGISGKITWSIEPGNYNIDTIIAKLATNDGEEELKMFHTWPVRKARPITEKRAPEEPLITGQRVVDAFFPLGKGGTACVPGPFGSGKTVIQHQLAKWADAEVIIYVGCGERGNEMTEVLQEFPKLEDPKSGKPLSERTVLVANTSNMPVAAREASVYTGITLGEYFRDMGYSVALMADSTSRWAEAMREMSGRLEEMPGEEGYPAYLGTRIAEFYERAGNVICLGDKSRKGALTVIGAVSPAGGDLSDPVVQATLRVVKVFWSLQAKLAYMRHFPAIGWLESYSLYTTNLKKYYDEKLGPEWVEMMSEAIALLQKEANLQEIAKLVGAESLSAQDQLILHVSRSLREDFLHQNAYHEIDTYASIKKQQLMMEIIMFNYKEMKKALQNGVAPKKLFELPVKNNISGMGYIHENNLIEIENIKKEIKSQIDALEERERNA